MFREVLSVLLLCVLCIAPGQAQTYVTASISFKDRFLTCDLTSPFNLEDGSCIMFMMVNNKRVAHQTGSRLRYKYKPLLIGKARCDVKCSFTKLTGDVSVSSPVIEINKTVFIGLCCGAIAALVLLVVAIIGGIHFKKNYYHKLDNDDHDDPIISDLEMDNKPKSKKPKIKIPPPPSAPAQSPPRPPKKISESESDDDNLKNDPAQAQRNDLYNYNPNAAQPGHFNYAEMSSEI